MTDKIFIKKETLILHKKSKISKEYTLGKTLGEGAFGLVRQAIHKATQQIRAIKILKKSKVDMEDLLKEISIVSKLSHPSIMQVYEMFEDNTNAYIVSEYCKGGELFDMITEKGSFSEKEACVIMQQLLSGIGYSHKNGIVHRDLKPENILMENNSDLNIKIVDWGCALQIKNKEKLHEIAGTSFYIAPEVLKGNYDEKCDIWSCGVILYILLSGHMPFYGQDDDEIYKKVLKGKYEFSEEEWNDVSNEAKKLIKKMLEKNPRKRISALNALKDDWFTINKENIKSNKILAKSVLHNMRKFKVNRQLEKITIAFIVNHFILKNERNDLQRQFKEWDKNGDGFLSKSEIIEGYKKIYRKVDENEIENMIKSIDLDGNGIIDYNEFLACSLHKDKILKNENLELCFKAFDSNNSGNISLFEIISIFNNGNKDIKDKEELEAFKKMVKDADEDEDDEISFKELKDLMKKFFI